jgi:hypothetical protein
VFQILVELDVGERERRGVGERGGDRELVGGGLVNGRPVQSDRGPRVGGRTGTMSRLFTKVGRYASSGCGDRWRRPGGGRYAVGHDPAGDALIEREAKSLPERAIASSSK